MLIRRLDHAANRCARDKNGRAHARFDGALNTEAEPRIDEGLSGANPEPDREKGRELGRRARGLDCMS
jgi:hypothetical protein